MTIGIISYNRKEMLEKCLYCIYATSTDEERDIIIWDNASTDDSQAFLGTVLDWPGVRVIQSDKNIGTECVFEMMKLVTTPYAFFLDCDCWVETIGWVNNIVKVYEADSTIAAVGLVPRIDDRARMGVTWEGIDYDKFVPPQKFRCENVNFRKPIEIPDFKDGMMDDMYHKRIAGIIMIYAPIGASIPGRPFAGTGMSYRVDLVRNCEFRPSSGILTDVGNLYSEYLLKTRPQSTYGWLHDHGFYHATGPWWNMGNMEVFYQEKSKRAPEIYNRSYEWQYGWFENAKKWSGWGRSLPKQ